MKRHLVIAILIMFMGNALPQSTAINTGSIGVDMNLYGRIQLSQPHLLSARRCLGQGAAIGDMNQQNTQ